MQVDTLKEICWDNFNKVAYSIALFLNNQSHQWWFTTKFYSQPETVNQA